MAHYQLQKMHEKQIPPDVVSLKNIGMGGAILDFDRLVTRPIFHAWAVLLPCESLRQQSHVRVCVCVHYIVLGTATGRSTRHGARQSARSRKGTARWAPGAASTDCTV